jgi:hypothetical protein
MTPRRRSGPGAGLLCGGSGNLWTDGLLLATAGGSSSSRTHDTGRLEELHW